MGIQSVPVGEFQESGGGMHVQPKCEEELKKSLERCVDVRETCSDDNVAFLDEGVPSSNVAKMLSSIMKDAEKGNEILGSVEKTMTKAENQVKNAENPKKITLTLPEKKQKHLSSLLKTTPKESTKEGDSIHTADEQSSREDSDKTEDVEKLEDTVEASTEESEDEGTSGMLLVQSEQSDAISELPALMDVDTDTTFDVSSVSDGDNDEIAPMSVSDNGDGGGIPSVMSFSDTSSSSEY